MTRYVVDASVGIKWFLPEIHYEAAGRLPLLNASLHVPAFFHFEAAGRLPLLNASLHVPAFFHLELSNVLSKKIRRDELAPEEGEAILKELQRVPIQKHSNERLMKPAFALAAETRRSFYDCLYLALAEAIDGQVVTADRKFCSSLAASRYGKRMLWVEDLPA